MWTHPTPQSNGNSTFASVSITEQKFIILNCKSTKKNQSFSIVSNEHMCELIQLHKVMEIQTETATLKNKAVDN